MYVCCPGKSKKLIGSPGLVLLLWMIVHPIWVVGIEPRVSASKTNSPNQ